MKQIGILLVLAAGVASLAIAQPILAADTTLPTPPTVVPQASGDRDLQRDLRGVPENIKTLIVTFDQTRDRYLQQQQLLRIRLNHATSPGEQDQIRLQLQANRQDFINELKGFRNELRTDIQAMKGKLGHAEFGRIIDAAHRAESGDHHRKK